MTKHKPLTEPCIGCPFRRRSLAGFLGTSSPERFIATTLNDERMPCHMTIDYRDPNWKERWEAKQTGEECAGAAVFFTNICKRSRDRTREHLPADHAAVFDHPKQFLEHHRSGARSWDEIEDAEGRAFQFPWEGKKP